MTAPSSDQPLTPDPRALAAQQARRAVMAVAKAHTLCSGAATTLSPEHREIAEEAFTLLEAAVRDLRDLVARLEGELDPAESGAREGHQR